MALSLAHVQAAERLAPTVARIADLVVASRVQHADETGVRIAGQLQWLHINSTRWLAHLAWHPKRGQRALETIGIWPRFRGWAIHAPLWPVMSSMPVCIACEKRISCGT